MSLKIARGFELPLDVVTEAIGIVATRGAGKSFTSAVLLEEAYANDVPFVVLDPSGVYHGLRSSYDGAKAGLPVYVFGGAHGDLPLEEHAGKLIADLVVDSGHSFVLDVSDFDSKAKARRFVADFLEALYARKARVRTTLLLVVDEADEFAPQKTNAITARSLGAMETIAKRGRARGLGIVLITQRTQALNKDVLDLIETLIVMRQLAERSRDAVKGWIADKDLRDEAGIIESLQALPTGTAWVWSPLRAILQKVQIRRIRTFDSYATPKPGEVRIEPTVRAELDLDALGEKMRATVEKAKSDNPGELRKEIARLRRELAEQRPADPVEVVREIPVFPRPLREAILQDYESAAATVERAAVAIREAADRAKDEIERDFDLALEMTAERPAPAPKVPPAGATPSRKKPAAPPEDPSNRGLNGSLGSGARRYVETLGRYHPTRMSVSQMAMLAGRKPRGGSFNTAMKELREGGYIEEDGDGIVLTERGIAEAGITVGQPRTPEETIGMWRDALPMAPREIFDLLVNAYPEEMTTDEIAAALDRAPRGGSWNTALKMLTSSGIVRKAGNALKADAGLWTSA